MKSRALCLLAILLFVSVAANAAETEKPAITFAQAVIEKAISFMPSDLKTKLTTVQKELIAAAKPVTGAEEATYSVDKSEGPGPSVLADQFQQVRKKVNAKATYTTLAPLLGKMAVTVISLSQPYHSAESAYKVTAHAPFEKQLDAASGSLKADFDGYQKADNPTEYAIQVAKHANESLVKLNGTDQQEIASVPGAVFTLAANSIADCWWTLLQPQEDSASSAATTKGNFIGNKRSLKFHLPTCKFQPAEKNQVQFKTREEAISEGYVPCKVCKP